MPVSVSLENSSNTSQVVKQFGIYSNVGLRIRGPDSSKYSRMGYPLSLAMSPDSVDLVLEPGEYLEDSGYYAYLHEFASTTGEVYTIQATLNGLISNEVQILAKPSDDAEMAELMMQDSVLNNLQGYRIEPKGMEIIREIAQSDRKSEYVKLAQFHLERVASGVDFDKMTGVYYSARGQPQVSEESASEYESANTELRDQTQVATSKSKPNEVLPSSQVAGSEGSSVWIILLPVFLAIVLCGIWWLKRRT